MSSKHILPLLILAFLFSLNLNAQNISIDVFVHNHKTYAPLDSALVKILRDGDILTASYTGVDGRTQLTITSTGLKETKSGLPNTFVVSKNYPNPFIDETKVDFAIPESQTVRVDIYNILGQQLLSDQFALSVGNYTLKVPFSNLPTGIYFLRLRGIEQQVVKLMKAGKDLLGERGVSGRKIMQVTPRSSWSLPLQKVAAETEEFTLEVEKDRYRTWSETKQIDSDTEITIPLVILDEYLLTDIDGNVYQTVKIGDQLWTAENLRTTRYRNGDDIPTGLDDIEWDTTEFGAFAIYPHGEIDGLESNEEVVEAYGKLYNWYAVDDSRGLCPDGWVVPSDDNWQTMVDNLGGWDVAGGTIKSTRTEPDLHPRWNHPNEAASNKSGFSGLPAAPRGVYGYYALVGLSSYWWSSSEYPLYYAWYRGLFYDNSYVDRGYDFKRVGRSVRCLKN